MKDTWAVHPDLARLLDQDRPLPEMDAHTRSHLRMWCNTMDVPEAVFGKMEQGWREFMLDEEVFSHTWGWLYRRCVDPDARFVHEF